MVWRGDLENDGLNRLARAGCGGERWPSSVRTRSTSGRWAPRSPWTTRWRPSPTIRPGPPALRAVPGAAGSRCGHGPRPGRRARRPRARGRSRRRHQPQRGPGPLRLCSASWRRHCGRTTSRWARRRGQPAGLARPGQIPDLPLPRPMFEIFVYSPRVEGVHLARREGRARRPALVRPAGGLPHRGPRTDEGADGEERRHRAGRRQGRLRRQGPAQGPGRAPGRGRRLLLDVHPWTARRDGQPRRRAGRRSPAGRAATRTTPTWSWRPTRASQPSPTSPTPSPRSTGSGWATPSRQGARPATTTRRWASRRAEPGSPCSATSATSASTCRTTTSRSRGSGTCRATSSATGCCCPGTSAWWRPSTTGTSSSTRIPTPRPASRSAPGCSVCPVPAGPTTTHR